MLDDVTDVTDTGVIARRTVVGVTTTEASGSNYLPVMLNPFEPGYFDNPYAQYRLVRDQDPVHMSPIGVLMWTGSCSRTSRYCAYGLSKYPGSKGLSMTGR